MGFTGYNIHMNKYLKELVIQIAKFGIVGVIAFVIDYGLFLLFTYVLSINYLVASGLSFTIATFFNFAASMRFVFAGKEGQTRTQQFVIFFVLSLLGLGLNQLILWMCVDLLSWFAWLGKLIATVIVMVFNFVTRKILLEDRKPRIDE